MVVVVAGTVEEMAVGINQMLQLGIVVRMIVIKPTSQRIVGILVVVLEGEGGE